MNDCKIRFAQFKDLKPIVNIYNQAIEAKSATADVDTFSVLDKEEWFKEHRTDEYPIYIIEIKNKVIGWGSISPYRKGRYGLKETAEISYYLDYNYHGQGFGKILLEYMIQDCKRLGINNLFALLLEINKPSIKILEKFGFNKWGYMPKVVRQHNFICGHLIYGKNLN